MRSLVPWGLGSYLLDEVPSRHQERSVAFRWALGGAEIRPTRLFVWSGERDTGGEWILPLGTRPKLLTLPRRRRHVAVLGCQVSYLGNPALTMLLFSYNWAAKLARLGASPSR